MNCGALAGAKQNKKLQNLTELDAEVQVCHKSSERASEPTFETPDSDQKMWGFLIHGSAVGAHSSCA